MGGGAAILSLLVVASSARAQTVDLRVALSPSTAPLVNAVTHATRSTISFDVTNSRAATNLRQFEIWLPAGYAIHGGLGPPGWSVTRITSVFSILEGIRFQVADCGQAGITAGALPGTFKIDTTPPTSPLQNDEEDPLPERIRWFNIGGIVAADPCGGPSGWSVTPPEEVLIPRKVLQVTGSVAPSAGAPPLTATVSWSVKNLASGTKNGVRLSGTTVTPPTGLSGGCLPASRNIPSGETGTFTCTYTISSPQAYYFETNAAGPSASALGASAGTVLVGSATATFAFDTLSAGPGDVVRAGFTVRNESGTAIDVTPPGYSALQLTNLSIAPGAADPEPAMVPAGGSRTIVYSLVVNGAIGASYVVQGIASTSVGPTNLAVTPAGTVRASRVIWTPEAVVKARVGAPYRYTVQVTNNSATPVSAVEISKPSTGTWSEMADAGDSSGLTYAGTISNGLRYSGTLPPGATAVLTFQFADIPTVTQTTFYQAQVRVVPQNGGQYSATYTDQLAVAIPPPDVSQLTVLSNAGGQVLAWTNTSSTGAPHDGVVVFRRPAGEVPTLPRDGVDYADPANGTSEVFYADRDGSSVNTLADPAIGAFRYRVCNHDALFVYSKCDEGFWNHAGWLDSVEAPAGGWTHQLGGTALLVPGMMPGNRVGIATNRPAVTVLDLASGDRTFEPVPLTSLPSLATPAMRLGNGRTVLFAADQAGVLTAIDIDAGASYWQAAKPGESFVAGVSGILRQYAAPAFHTAYPNDVLLVGSTSGRVLAVDATTGVTLWSVDAGSGVRALIHYDAATNRIFVPTTGAGVIAYDLASSSPSAPPAPASGWQNAGGSYRLHCIRTPFAGSIGCINATGLLRLIDTATGATLASLQTGVTSPSSLWRVTGATPGFVVSSASRVQRVVAAGSPVALTAAGEWAPPGLTLSPVQVFSAEGAIVVGASDRRLHKLALSDAHHTGASSAIPSQDTDILVGPVAYDVANDTFVFGTDDGRVWAVPFF
jgi:outer membrane protein assembly factor BamB